MVRRRLAAATIRHDFELDLLAIGQAIQARAFNGADVDEHVGAAAIRLDEAEALLGVEPLYGSILHRSNLLLAGKEKEHVSGTVGTAPTHLLSM